MEYSYSQAGDELGDIVRASGGNKPTDQISTIDNNNPNTTWPLLPSDLMDLQENTYDCFENPFIGIMRDNHHQLLQEICMPNSSLSFFSDNTSADPMNKITSEEPKGLCGEDQARVDHHNILSRMIQISSTSNTEANSKLLDTSSYGSAILSASPREVVKPTFISGDMIIKENSGIRISSPQSSSAKRRKKEAKKVICIPVPPSNGKSSGEVVPPDLWAWRKYGQKPIKGSPYPRGYYRCSSSKGCPARKQVEKSRNDPNMLVVTYTCEHNHAWPTQRNALAGSTRAQAQPSKSNASSNPKNSPSSSSSQMEKDLNNEESKEAINGEHAVLTNVKKEERIAGFELEMNMDEVELSEPYRFQHFNDQMTVTPDSNRFSEDFFAELTEIETNSIDDLLLNPGKSTGDDGNECKAMDPIFSFLDWSSGT